MEIKQISEREIWLGESRFYLDEDNILYENIVGEFDEKRALMAKDVVLKLMNMVNDKINIFIDLNNAGHQTSKARKIGQEMFEHEINKKIALFGMNPISRVIGSFVIGVTGKKDIRFFKSKEDALSWLKE
jgi:hypothetical protein